jgi:hypothetical protein
MSENHLNLDCKGKLATMLYASTNAITIHSIITNHRFMSVRIARS